MGDVNLGLCPYCQSDEVISLQSSASDGYGRSSISVSTFKSIQFARLICLQCGSVREWVANRQDLDLLRKKYGRAQDRS
jgi:hypothetical protein